MGLQTSEVTTASNTTLQLNPSGTGKVRLNKLSGNGINIVSIDNAGDTNHFRVASLGTESSPQEGDFLLIERSGLAPQKVSLRAAVDGSGGGSGAALQALSVNTAAASGGGSLTYASNTGVFTFAPAKMTDVTYSAGSGLSLSSNAFAINLQPLPDR